MWRRSHILKKRKVRRVIGWLLSLQLRSPGWGWVCAFSIVYAVELPAWCLKLPNSVGADFQSVRKLTTFVLHHV